MGGMAKFLSLLVPVVGAGILVYAGVSMTTALIICAAAAAIIYMGWIKIGKPNVAWAMAGLVIGALLTVPQVGIADMVGLGQGKFTLLGGMAAPAAAPVAPAPTTTVTTGTTGLAAGCGSTKIATLNVTVINALNTTAAEGGSPTGYVYHKSNGEFVSSFAVQKDGGAITLDCGDTYTIKFVATNSEGAISTKMLSVQSGPARIDSGNNLEVDIGQPTVRVIASAREYGLLQARAWDVKNAAWIWANLAPGGTNTEYVSSPAGFQSTTNGTNYVVGSGGEVHARYSVRPVAIDTTGNDRGWCLLYHAVTSAWQDPYVAINGVQASDVKGTLNVDEQRAYGSTYEKAYCVDNDMTLNSETNIELDVFALPGVDPSAATQWINMTILPRTAFLSKDAVTVKIALVNDNAAPTAILTAMVIEQRVS
jgi:hypothetical protein